MKYIKKYENTTDYKIGDFIKIEIENNRLEPYPIVEIVDIIFDKYHVEYINQKINKIRWVSIRKSADHIIKGLATPEEIEEFKIMRDIVKNSNKYNI